MNKLMRMGYNEIEEEANDPKLTWVNNRLINDHLMGCPKYYSTTWGDEGGVVPNDYNLHTGGGRALSILFQYHPEMFDPNEI